MATSSNWQKYIDLLFRKRIPENQQRWYVKWVEDFLKAYPGEKPQGFLASDLETYSRNRSRVTSLTVWQYRQMVDAMQLLFVGLSATSLSKNLDWGHWREAYSRSKA